jgi:hypothetical protein
MREFAAEFPDFCSGADAAANFLFHPLETPALLSRAPAPARR